MILAGIPGVSDCTLVTDTHLAAITSLNLSGQGMTALHADDFAGSHPFAGTPSFQQRPDDADGAPLVTDVATTRISTPMNGLPRARGRLVQTFKFLKELTELRNPVQRELDAEVFRLDSWPVHPCITVRRGDPSEEDDQDAAGKELEPYFKVFVLSFCSIWEGTPR